MSAKVWVGDGTNKFATDYLPADQPVTISDDSFTLHVHAADGLQPCLHSPCCPPPMLSLVQEKAVIITGIRAGTASDCYACAVGRTMPTED